MLIGNLHKCPNFESTELLHFFPTAISFKSKKLFQPNQEEAYQRTEHEKGSQTFKPQFGLFLFKTLPGQFSSPAPTHCTWESNITFFLTPPLTLLWNQPGCCDHVGIVGHMSPSSTQDHISDLPREREGFATASSKRQLQSFSVLHSTIK